MEDRERAEAFLLQGKSTICAPKRNNEVDSMLSPRIGWDLLAIKAKNMTGPGEI